MKTITAYQCTYCGKVYENKTSCNSHQYKCYFNPKTKSCASCAFQRFDYYTMPNQSITGVRTCIMNIDIESKQRTKCPKYLFQGNKEVDYSLKEAELNYDPTHFVKRRIAKIMDLNRKKSDSRDTTEKLTNFLFHTYMNHLMASTAVRMQSQKKNLIPSFHEEEYPDQINECIEERIGLGTEIFNMLAIDTTRAEQVVQQIETIWNKSSSEAQFIEYAGYHGVLENVNSIHQLSKEKGESDYFDNFLLSDELTSYHQLIKSLIDQKDAEIPGGCLINSNTLSVYYEEFSNLVGEVDSSLCSELKTRIHEAILLNI